MLNLVVRKVTARLKRLRVIQIRLNPSAQQFHRTCTFWYTQSYKNKSPYYKPTPVASRRTPLLLVLGRENSLSAILHGTECNKRIILVITQLLHSIWKQLKIQCHPLTKRRTNDAQWKCYPIMGKCDNRYTSKTHFWKMWSLSISCTPIIQC
jgi:hypothetical protein